MPAPQGRYAEALRYYERSLRLKEKLGDEPEPTLTLSNIGSVHGNQGRYAEALGTSSGPSPSPTGPAWRSMFRRHRDNARAWLR